MAVPRADAGQRLAGGDGGYTVKVEDDAPRAATYTVHGPSLCLTRGSRVSVIGVRLVGVRGGARVTDFTVMDRHVSVGLVKKRIDRLRPLEDGTRQVRRRCDADEGTADLFVEVTRPAGSAVAGGSAIGIAYRDGDRIRHVRKRIGVFVCADLEERRCREA
ncbi:hypothetical protein [Nocardioides nanhaiensis]|uniref:hypothetical protein n=1 Tax=Nocardioides nanhaiensis TaxID=1476871 RepID=UPI0031F0E658